MKCVKDAENTHRKVKSIRKWVWDENPNRYLIENVRSKSWTEHNDGKLVTYKFLRYDNLHQPIVYNPRNNLYMKIGVYEVSFSFTDDSNDLDFSDIKNSGSFEVPLPKNLPISKGFLFIYFLHA